MENLLTPEVLLVLVGAAIPAAVTLISSGASAIWGNFKEAKAWERQQKAEADRFSREQGALERERRREAYEQSLRSLGLLNFVDKGDSKALSPQELAQIHDDIQKWVGQLVLWRGDPAINGVTLEHLLYNVNGSDVESYVYALREGVIELYKSDPLLNNGNQGLNPLENEQLLNAPRHFTFFLDPTFRREKFIEGKEVDLEHTITYNIQELTSSQREKLAALHLGSTKLFPKQVLLQVPARNKLRLNWMARIDPKDSTPEQIFAAWETDYDTALRNSSVDAKA